MCINCPDMVETCWEEGCCGPEFLADGRHNPYGRCRKFYLDDDLCDHLRTRYGVATARELDAILRPARYEDMEDETVMEAVPGSKPGEPARAGGRVLRLPLWMVRRRRGNGL